MALKGDTSNLLLADIFQTLSQNQQTGILTLKLSEESRKILFAPAGVTLLDARVFKASRFAHLITVGGLVPREQADATIQQVDGLGSQPFSAVTMIRDLASRKVLDEETALQVLVIELREEIFEIFAHPRMEFEFDESDVPIEEIPRECLFRTEEIVFEAARRVDEWQLIQKSLGELDEFYIATTDSAGSSSPSDEPDQHPEIIEKLDGSRTITDVAEALLLPRFEVAKIVAKLFTHDRVRLAGADELINGARSLDARANGPRVVRLLHRARSRMSKPDVRLEDMAALYSSAGIPSAAVSVLLERAEFLKDSADDEASFSLVLRAREYDPENARVLGLLADLYAERGDRNAEIDVLCRLADRSARTENFDRAVDIGERIAQLDPDSTILDQSFASWCEKAEKKSFGAAVLSKAVGLRSSPDRATVLYEAILRLDPTRADIRKQLTGLKQAQKKSRIFWVASILIAVGGLGSIGYLVLERMKEQRLQGRYDGAAVLVDKGEEHLAESELKAILVEAGSGEIRTNAERLLSVIRERQERDAEQKREAHDDASRVQLQAVQVSIDNGDLAAALDGLTKLEGTLENESLVKLHELKHGVLFDQLRKEKVELARLAVNFKVPDNDSDLLEIDGTYAALFSRDRLENYRRFRETVEALPETARNRTALLEMASACIASIESARPGLDEVEARLKRNEELDELSDDYERVLVSVREGKYDDAIASFEILLKDYGDGPLTSYFEKQLAQTQVASRALQEVHQLLAAGDANAANARARRAVDEIDSSDIDFARCIGFPVRVDTLPHGARISLNDEDMGAAPVDVWVKPEETLLIVAESSGFNSRELSLDVESPPEIAIDLERVGRFHVKLDASIDAAPVVSNGDLFVGARDGVLYKIDPHDGSQISFHATSSLAGVAHRPLLFEDSIIVPLGEGSLHAIDKDTMAPLWETSLGGALAGPPILMDSKLFVALVDGAIIEVSPDTGSARQIAGVRGPLRSGPAVIGRVLAVGTTQGQVLGISLDDGRTIFSTERLDQPIVVLVAASENFLVADDAGLLRSLDPETGDVAWQKKTGASTAARAVEQDGLVLFAAGHRAYVLNASDGEVRIEVETLGWISATPVLSGGRLYVGDRTGTLHVFDSSTGSPVYRHALSAPISAPPLVLPEGILVVSESGEVALLGS